MKLLKQIERNLRKQIDRLIVGSNSPVIVDKPETIFNNNSLKKILLLRHDRIGDLLITTPFLKILRDKLPQIQIDILLSRKNSGAFRAADKFVDNIFIYDKKFQEIFKLIKKLRRRKYDLIIDLFDNVSTTSNIIIRLLHTPRVLGLSKENNGIYTHVVPLPDKLTNHIVDRVAMLMLPFRIDPKNCIKELYYPISDVEKIEAETALSLNKERVTLGINLSGSGESKFWGIDNHINFIKQLKQRYHDIDIYIFTTKEHEVRQKEIIESTGAQAIPIVSSFHEYACLLSACDILLAPDTSAVHLASAWKMPCIALYQTAGAPFGMPWTPYNSPSKVLTVFKDELKKISVESVLNAFEELYNERLKSR